MKRLVSFLICGLFVIVSMTSCSVIMAAKKEGVDVSRIQACRTRGQVLATGIQPIESQRLSDTEFYEVYQVQRPRGSAARAFMHGALDICTCGIWEAIGTPIEACVDQKEFYCLKITYDNCENIQKVEIQ